MTRRKRILRNFAITVAALVFLVTIAAIQIVQTDWFRNYVKQKIITATEEGTGGKVDIASFSFDWKHLEAVITDFVIHGSEPAGGPPFVRTGRVQVNIRLLPGLRRWFDIAFLAVDRPEVNVLVAEDGSTNVPAPRKVKTSETTPLETIVDLAIGKFDLTNGFVAFNSHKQALDVRGKNLRTQLWYNLLRRGYQGQVALEPIYVISGRNTPVTFTVTLPVVLERDRIGFDNAKIATSASDVTVNGSLENLRNPKTSIRVNGHLALADLKNVGDLPLVLEQRDTPQAVQLDANVTFANDTIEIGGLRAGLGNSNVEASGTLKDPKGNGSLQFKSHLVMGELGRLANVAQRPEGTVVLNGTAKLDAANDYRVAGNVSAQNVAFRQDDQYIRNVSLTSALNLDRRRLDLKGLRVNAFGGEFAGNASLEEFRRYQVNGNLRNLSLLSTAQAFGQKTLPYDGIVSGPVDARGDLKQSGTRGISATARLAIAPGRRGIPLSGRLNAAYSGDNNNIAISDSYLALPHTRLNLSGSLNNRLNLDLRSTDLHDLLAALPASSVPQIALNGGEARFTGSVTGELTAPRVMGHLAVNRFVVEDRQFDSLAADVDAAKSRASVQNGTLTRAGMRTQFAASVGMVNWALKPDQPLSVTATVRNGDLGDVMVLAGRPSAGYAGQVSADVTAGGTVGNPSGSANLQALNGKIEQEPFDRIDAKVNLADQLITIPSAAITAGPAQVNLTAEFQHPRDSFLKGRLHVGVKSNQVDLAQIQTLQRERPSTGGSVQVDADLNGTLSTAESEGKKSTEFLVTGVSGQASAQALRFDGQSYGDVTAKASTSGQAVSYTVDSNFAGSTIHATGNTQLTRDYPTTGDANIGNLPVERVLVLAKRSDIRVRGKLSGTVHFTGTADHSQGNADVDLASAVIYDEPADHVRARVSYVDKTIDVSKFEVTAGPSRIDATARYDHPEGDLKSGELVFKVNSSRIDMTRIKNVQELRPGLGGTLAIAANGSATIRDSGSAVLFRDLNADIGATGIAVQGKNFGNLTLKANTNAGNLNFTLDSDLAGSSIHGRGDAQLNGDYPLNAQLTFKDVTWAKLEPLVGAKTGQAAPFDAVTDGQVEIRGPALKTGQLRGALRISRLEMRSIPRVHSRDKPMVIQNQGELSATLDNGIVRIGNAHLTGPDTDITATGTAAVFADKSKSGSQNLDLSLNATANLALVQNFTHEIFASGGVVVVTSVRGTIQKPLVNGRLELKNASVNYTDFPNGLSNANGLILFNGTTATIRNLSGESGGGKVNFTGFANYEDTLRMGLRANASGVRYRLQQGVSVTATANVNLSGTTESSLASGTVTIDSFTYAPQSDFGSLLTRAAPPIQSPATPSPLLDNMKLDIRVVTSASTSVQASLAQNLQIASDLRIRGRASQPAALGRITITQGDLVFFGSTYKVSTGTVSFYNSFRIAPILNITLETQAKGVNVVLTITGPIDNMKLSYTSDPPLQFQEIVALLASGKTPTSDPTLLANQPSTPSQSYQQMGESAVVSKALADPVANRLQRVFGVSQLKIDPSFNSGSDLPQARVTLQQQISSNLVFTYVTALDDPNTSIVRVEWSLNPQWSAIAGRDQNGIVSLNFLYKRQFR